MASIVKRRKKYSVVYRFKDENGKDRQRWETFETLTEAKNRKIQVEMQQGDGTFSVPEAKTVNDLMTEYMSIYGVNTWALSTYESRQALNSHYIAPIIGDLELSKITPRIMDQYFNNLTKVRSVVVNNRKPDSEYLSPRRIKEIHKVLRSAFNQAVKWELMSRNPVENATLPKYEAKPRNIWDAETVFKAIELCEQDEIALAINLAFSCSLRIGELLGLTWDCVDISEESINRGQAYVFVNKELQRVSRSALEALDERDVIFKFPATARSTSTSLVLKTPKTKTSVRKIFLPKTVAEMLIKWREGQQEYKEIFGDEYLDYNMVMASPIGRPYEGCHITRGLKKVIRDNDLPDVVFHSLRHSSITYKLKLNGGDIKSVQGDSGHAQSKMVADVYSHILDNDRCLNAQRFETEFYSGKEDKNDVTGGEATAGGTSEREDDVELIMRLLQKPETAQLLKALASTL